MGEWSDPYNIIGFAGGVVLAASLLPQIYLAQSRKSTADISYLWQAVYTVGLITLMVYYAHFELWAVFYPMAFEFSCLMYLTGLKLYYEVFMDKPLPTLATGPEFDMSRSGHVGRMPSKLAVEALSDASKSGRMGRMLSDTSKSGRMGRMLSDTSKSGVTGRAVPSPSVAANDSRKGGKERPPPVVGKPAVARLFGGAINSEGNPSIIEEGRGEAKEAERE